MPITLVRFAYEGVHAGSEDEVFRFPRPLQSVWAMRALFATKKAISGNEMKFSSSSRY